ncbi:MULTISPECIES: IS200/IS605 family transposase [unclassified Candidatus Frackibacter]|uniref:IS200/IS605 family transposase n=2 Tax=Candidatus Frackibacter TaxID=2017975 RepID=UPI0008B53E6A|nr:MULTISPECIES: IS200/IS605 family transposase [unclassified Candidatus Frackibacter]SEM84428.1 putative transposase [Candidatus Frackibacter sp. WG12]SEM96030.1 putative transposase [Candidatus Frackibacter sp. WG12]SFL93630.1 putative transposase [Candidatus Frackibacter sp. WG13]SFM04345.1 putative transposase [Candidatus Frackibacter sp. WG13]
MNTYKSTRHAKFLLNYHFIWIPKYRKQILDNPQIKQLILDTINELADKHNFEVLATEIMPDHIHLFISALPKYSPSKLMNIIKGTTGRRISKHFPELNIKGSVWTRAYFVATAGNVSSETIQHYVENQR